jgi:hypothetical protein
MLIEANILLFAADRAAPTSHASPRSASGIPLA